MAVVKGPRRVVGWHFVFVSCSIAHGLFGREKSTAIEEPGPSYQAVFPHFAQILPFIREFIDPFWTLLIESPPPPAKNTVAKCPREDPPVWKWDPRPPGDAVLGNRDTPAKQCSQRIYRFYKNKGNS